MVTEAGESSQKPPYLQVSVAEVNGCPRTVLLLLIVATTETGPFWQVARPWGLIGTFAESEVDHVPNVSGIRGQLPLTEEVSENCA
jgi:hypothetical protein